jgi:hypothetical protein
VITATLRLLRSLRRVIVLSLATADGTAGDAATLATRSATGGDRCDAGDYVTAAHRRRRLSLRCDHL